MEGIAARRVVPVAHGWRLDCARIGTRNVAQADIPCGSESVGHGLKHRATLIYSFCCFPHQQQTSTMHIFRDRADSRWFHVMMANFPLPPSASSHRFSARPTNNQPEEHRAAARSLRHQLTPAGCCAGFPSGLRLWEPANGHICNWTALLSHDRLLNQQRMTQPLNSALCQTSTKRAHL
jgi:hypothetical protein